MAKIVLVWNRHPGESPVTLPLAKLLKTNLEKRGYEVKIERFRHNKSGKKITDDLDHVPDFLKKYPDSVIVDLHSGPYVSNRKVKPGKELRISYSYGNPFEIENSWPEITRRNKRFYQIEFPSIEDFSKTWVLRANLKKTKAENYFSGIVIRRIAYAIDRVVKSPEKFDEFVKAQKEMRKQKKKNREKNKKKKKTLAARWKRLKRRFNR